MRKKAGEAQDLRCLYDPERCGRFGNASRATGPWAEVNGLLLLHAPARSYLGTALATSYVVELSTRVCLCAHLDLLDIRLQNTAGCINITNYWFAPELGTGYWRLVNA